MFSKDESKQLRIDFWNTFGNLSKKKRKKQPWLLYNTKIKDVSLKFVADKTHCAVVLDIEIKNTEKRHRFFNNMQSLQTIFNNNFEQALIWQKELDTDNKQLSRIYIDMQNVSIYNKSNWPDMFTFLYENMTILENTFTEYKEIIDNFVE